MNSTEQISSFVRILQGKGQITSAVANQTRAALGKIDEIFDGTDEAGPSVDELASMEKVEEMFNRHLTKFPAVLTPASARKYAQRVVKAAENLISKNNDPINFKPTFHTASLDGDKIRSKAPPKSQAKPKLANEIGKSSEKKTGASALGLDSEEILTAFPLRADYVWKAPIPKGLTKTEVRRLAYHLLGFCPDFDPGEPIWRHDGPAPQGALAQQDR